MANRQDGEISIRLDRVRTLKYGFNGFAEFEDLTGKTIHAVFRDLQDAEHAADVLGYSMVRKLLWAGLIEEDPSLTVRDVGQLIDQADGETAIERFTYAINKVSEAMGLNFGSSEKNSQKEPETTGTGTQS